MQPINPSRWKQLSSLADGEYHNLVGKSSPTSPPFFTALIMHWLWKIPRYCAHWGTGMFSRAFHINIKKQMSIQWGHQEVPAKSNFASDVIDHWANMEKVTGERMAQFDWLHSFINSFGWDLQDACYASDTKRSCEQDINLPWSSIGGLGERKAEKHHMRLSVVTAEIHSWSMCLELVIVECSINRTCLPPHQRFGKYYGRRDRKNIRGGVWNVISGYEMAVALLNSR